MNITKTPVTLTSSAGDANENEHAVRTWTTPNSDR
jgi:hypothetical protein